MLIRCLSERAVLVLRTGTGCCRRIEYRTPVDAFVSVRLVSGAILGNGSGQLFTHCYQFVIIIIIYHLLRGRSHRPKQQCILGRLVYPSRTEHERCDPGRCWTAKKACSVEQTENTVRASSFGDEAFLGNRRSVFLFKLNFKESFRFLKTTFPHTHTHTHKTATMWRKLPLSASEGRREKRHSSELFLSIPDSFWW